MPEDRTVLDHLLDGRDALLQEVTRLTAAIEQLDSVLGRIGASDRSDGNGSVGRTSGPGTGPTTTSPETNAVAAPVATTVEQVVAEPVNPPAEVEPEVPAPTRAVAPRSSAKKAAKKAPAKVAAKAPAKKAAAKKVAPRAVVRQGEPPKSIRVHVLEMLAAENRDFGLAEIIDRVHDAGIQAHDDAVRSITIKLMKDGRVERVGRGQYRLARRGAAARAASAATATAPRVTETAPEPPAAQATPVEPPVESVAPAEPPVVSTEPEPEPIQADENDSADGRHQASAAEVPVEPEPEAAADEIDEPTEEPAFSPVSVPRTYTPPLNLGQPWSGGK